MYGMDKERKKIATVKKGPQRLFSKSKAGSAKTQVMEREPLK